MNQKTHEPFEEIVPLYAAGALDRQERQAFEAHLLTGCVACHAAFKDYRTVAGLLPYGLPPVAPPPALKAQLMAAVTSAPAAAPVAQSTPAPEPARPSQTAQQARPLSGTIHEPSDPFSSSRAPHPAMIPLLVLLIIGAGAYSLFIRSKLETEKGHRQQVERALRAESARIASLQQQIADQERAVSSVQQEVAHRAESVTEVRNMLTDREAELAQLRAELAQRDQDLAGLRRGTVLRDEMLALLRSPNVKTVALAGLEPGVSAGALLLVEPESRRALLYAFNLPLLPPGSTYQLWAITDNKPFSAATFTIDAGQKARVMIRNLPELTFDTKLAVSMEPEGGRPQPTGAFYLTGRP